MAAFEARSEARTGVYTYERPPEVLTADEEARFRADEAAWADWERRPPSYRRTVVGWIAGAKQPATRARRFEALLADSAAGRPVGPMRWARDGKTA